MSTGRRLAIQHAPVFHFHPNEGDFCGFPSSAEDDYSRILAGATSLARGPRSLPPSTPCYFEHFPPTADLPERVRYWLWYSFNDFPALEDVPIAKNAGNHSGDWENVIITLTDGVPFLYYLSNHNTARCLHPNQLMRDSDSRVHVWVALGSHALYESPTCEPFAFFGLRGVTDQIADGGASFDPRATLIPISSTTFGSVAYARDWSIGTNLTGPIHGPPVRSITQYDNLLPNKPDTKPTNTNTNMSLEEAIDKAFAGQEVKFVKVDGHEFHIKPIKVITNGENKGTTGQISHHLTARDDDQIQYKITIKNGQAEATHSITRGGLGRMLGIPGKLADIGGKAIDGSWEAACLHIINTISLKLELA